MTLEKCIWKALLSGGNKLYKFYSAKSSSKCNACKGYKHSCSSYLSNEEIERRNKETELNEYMRSER